jgi:hypothetical protein
VGARNLGVDVGGGVPAGVGVWSTSRAFLCFAFFACNGYGDFCSRLVRTCRIGWQADLASTDPRNPGDNPRALLGRSGSK